MRTERNKSNSRLDYRTLEPRICLAVTASVTQTGSLAVRGVADGLVEITAVAPETFRVTDNGNEIATLDRVRRNIAVKLRDGPLDDTVRVNLLNQAVENVVVELKDGDNDFQINGNVPIQRVIYRGGNGRDNVVTNVETATITAVFGSNGVNNFTAQNDSLRFRYRGGAQADFVNFENVNATWIGVVLGDGNNVVDSSANVSRQQFIRGGANKDTITSADISATSSFDLGGGSNVVNVDGNYQRLFLRGGNEQDTIFYDTQSRITSRLGVDLAGGNNFMRMAGQVDSSMFFNATDGDDNVFIDAAGQFLGDVTVLFGHGVNRFTHNGAIQGDLLVTSFNVADTYIVNGTVGGRLILRPGGQGS